MSTKPTLNILFAAILLSPALSAASCLNNNDSVKNITTSDCGYNAGDYLAELDTPAANQPASEQQRLVQYEFSTPGVSQKNQAGSRTNVKKSPTRNDSELDNFDWFPAAWYEVY